MKRETLEAILAAHHTRSAIVLVTDLAGGEQQLIRGPDAAATPMYPPALRQAVLDVLGSGNSATIETEGQRYFLRAWLPAPRLIVVGAVHIAQALIPMAMQCGYEVFLVDPRTAFASTARFPGVNILPGWPDRAVAEIGPDGRTAMVALSHDPKLDEPALLAALHSGCFYIGALGSRRTHARRLERLREFGLDSTALDRIHGPIGLRIGARSPAEIAVSIMAEITATLHGAGNATP